MEMDQFSQIYDDSFIPELSFHGSMLLYIYKYIYV